MSYRETIIKLRNIIDEGYKNFYSVLDEAIDTIIQLATEVERLKQERKEEKP